MYYARVLPPIPVCIGFWDKKLRDEWVAEQNRKDKERHDDLLKSLNASERDCPWEEKAKAALTAAQEHSVSNSMLSAALSLLSII